MHTVPVSNASLLSTSCLGSNLLASGTQQCTFRDFGNTLLASSRLVDTTRPNNRQCWLHLKLLGSLAACTFLRSEDFLGTTYRFTLARPLVMEVRKTIINNTHGMSLVNFVNERVSFNACVCIEWISLVNGLPLQCRMTFLTPSHTHTHTHTHTHYSRASMMPSRLNPSSTMKEETN